MIRETLLDIFSEIWPMILIFSVVLTSLRLSYLIINKQKFVFYKELLSLLFIIYILCLFHVVTFQDVSYSSNFIPFKEMFRYDFGSRLFFKNVIGNMLMFLPYGFFVSSFLKLKKPYLIILLTFITSLTIEVTQLSIGRVFDIDDIFLNLFGGIFGYILYRFIFIIREKLPKCLKKELFYNIIMIALILGLILYFTKVISIGGVYE